MSRPTRHPKTGMYWAGKAVPSDLRAVVGKRELTETLRTKDWRLAKERAAAVYARFDALLAEARDAGRRLSERDIAALTGAWYRAEITTWGDNPGDPENWSLYLDDIGSRWEDQDPNGDATRARIFLKPQDRAEAAALLQEHGYYAAPGTVTRLAEALLPVKLAFCREMIRRAGGDWSHKMPQQFPELRSPKTPDGTLQKIIIPALVAAWAAESSTSGKALYDRERTAAAFATFLGHDDAGKVTADDVVRWKEARLAAGRSVKTVANDIGELRPTWTWAKRNRKLTFAENPFSGLAPRPKKRGRRARDPYSEEDARRVLEAARSEKEAVLRWLPWLLCTTGARLGEIMQATKEDFAQQGEGGPWVLHIHSEGANRTLKTPHSERMVPLHPALVAEGFADYLKSLPDDSPLFPAVRPDKFGSRGGTATKKFGRWVRDKVGITDERIDPAHGFRACSHLNSYRSDDLIQSSAAASAMPAA